MNGTEFAPAKINLFLHVTGRRPDGYHLIDSLAVFADVGDRLTAAPAPEWSLVVRGRFAAGLDNGPTNLVSRAAMRFAGSGAAPRMAMLLDKELPVASGIGGGSADAAAALRLLSRMTGADSDLPAMALALGADVPVCLLARPARMGGIGDILTGAPTLPRFGLVLINPGAPVATGAVFAARTAPFSPPATLADAFTNAPALAAALAKTRNDLAAAARALCPAIDPVLAALAGHPDCLLARMSGSGATCFGIFIDPLRARAAAAALSRPEWWSWGGGLAGEPGGS